MTRPGQTIDRSFPVHDLDISRQIDHFQIVYDLYDLQLMLPGGTDPIYLHDLL